MPGSVGDEGTRAEDIHRAPQTATSPTAAGGRKREGAVCAGVGGGRRYSCRGHPPGTPNGHEPDRCRWQKKGGRSVCRGRWGTKALVPRTSTGHPKRPSSRRAAGGIVKHRHHQSPSQKSKIFASPLYTRGPFTARFLLPMLPPCDMIKEKGDMSYGLVGNRYQWQ